MNDLLASCLPRKKPSRRSAVALVDAVLVASDEMVRIRSLEKISTNSIARRAGVSVGSLYQYFPNKEAIFLASISHKHDLIAQDIRQECERWSPNVRVSLVVDGLCDGILRFADVLKPTLEQLPLAWAHGQMVWIEGQVGSVVTELLFSGDVDEHTKSSVRIMQLGLFGAVYGTLFREPELLRCDSVRRRMSVFVEASRTERRDVEAVSEDDEEPGGARGFSLRGDWPGTKVAGRRDGTCLSASSMGGVLHTASWEE